MHLHSIAFAEAHVVRDFLLGEIPRVVFDSGPLKQEHNAGLLFPVLVPINIETRSETAYCRAIMTSRETG